MCVRSLRSMESVIYRTGIPALLGIQVGYSGDSFTFDLPIECWVLVCEICDLKDKIEHEVQGTLSNLQAGSPAQPPHPAGLVDYPEERIL